MYALHPCLQCRFVLTLSIFAAASLTYPSILLAQSSPDSQKVPDSHKISEHLSPKLQDTPASLAIHILNPAGAPLGKPVEVRLLATAKSRNLAASAQEDSVATLKNVLLGDYELEVSSPGYATATQHLHVVNCGHTCNIFVYLNLETAPDLADLPNSSVALKPELQQSLDKGLLFLQKKQYDKASRQFAALTRSVPRNPNVWYLHGVAELALSRRDAARKDFYHALSLDPTHEKSLLALAELELNAGAIPSAIDFLETAYRSNGADWRTHFLLASAYAQEDRLADAEVHASRAVALANSNAALPLMLLADIFEREGKKGEATQLWQRVLVEFPSDPISRQASIKLGNPPPAVKYSGDLPDRLPLAILPELSASAASASAWAPPDVDAREYATAPNISCDVGEILNLAQDRLNSQLLNFEKFTATEHVVHQEIDPSSGIPFAPKEKDFSYIVFVEPYAGNSSSLLLDESRDGGSSYSSFPTPMVTTGLNSLGVSLLQPANRDSFIYRCEGLTNIRGQAAWQLYFEEKPNATASIRRWRTNKATYNIPVKGRLWLTSTSYDMLRVETDLLSPIETLNLTRDHLEVNYGPISFQGGKQWLWLPWNAEMYMELHRKRFHHRHFLTDYMLFGVDETQKVSAPKSPSPDAKSTQSQ